MRDPKVHVLDDSVRRRFIPGQVKNRPAVNRAACLRRGAIKPSELGGVLQDAHYREQDYTDDEEGQCHDGSGDGEPGPHG